jgi:hypothetical protein
LPVLESEHAILEPKGVATYDSNVTLAKSAQMVSLPGKLHKKSDRKRHGDPLADCRDLLLAFQVKPWRKADPLDLVVGVQPRMRSISIPSRPSRADLARD